MALDTAELDTGTTLELNIAHPRAAIHAKLAKGPGAIGTAIFGVVLLIGGIYVASQLIHDLSEVHLPSITPYLFLGLALLIALGFEFVNGFHDTANAVATVIYTHTLEPHMAVALSGILNFTGVMFSSGGRLSSHLLVAGSGCGWQDPFVVGQGSATPPGCGTVSPHALASERAFGAGDLRRSLLSRY